MERKDFTCTSHPDGQWVPHDHTKVAPNRAGVEEALVADTRGELSPVQAVDQKLSALLHDTRDRRTGEW
jgi:hypothetical protein